MYASFLPMPYFFRMKINLHKIKDSNTVCLSISVCCATLRTFTQNAQTVILSIALICLFTIRAAAQQKTFFEVASVGAGYQSSPTIDVPGQTAVLYTSTVAKMPFVLKNGDIILAGATVQHHQMYRSADGLFAPEIIGRGRIGYSHAGVIAGFVHSIGDGASLSLVAMPYIASDFGDITSDDFRCEFVTLLSHKFNEVLTYKYGTMLAYSFAGPDLWPLLGSSGDLSRSHLLQF